MSTEIEIALPRPVGSEGDASLRGVEVGEGTRTAIVLHGGPGASLDYLRPQLDLLVSDDRRLVYYDQRGGGRSLLPSSWPAAGIDVHVADVQRVIDGVTPPGAEKPALVGYSWGGLLALSFALQSPESIGALLLIAPAPPNAAGRDEMRRRLRASQERPEVAAFIESLHMGKELTPENRRLRFAARVAGYFHDPRRALELSPFVVRERAERAIWDSLGDYDLRPKLSTLAVPTLVIHGVEDPVPIESAREVAALSGAKLIEIPRCGHAPYIEGAETFFPAARAFLDATSS